MRTVKPAQDEQGMATQLSPIQTAEAADSSHRDRLASRSDEVQLAPPRARQGAIAGRLSR